jgi:hypothetical protein
MEHVWEILGPVDGVQLSPVTVEKDQYMEVTPIRRITVWKLWQL